MMKHEWRKHEKALYGAANAPAVLEVPLQNFIMLRGRGDPNQADFADRVAALYALAYAVKKTFRAAGPGAFPPGTAEDFSVYPLEGVWEAQTGEGLTKSALEYTLMIRQPDCVTAGMVRDARTQVRARKPNPLYDQILFGTMEDGLCVQMLHTGSYDNEPAAFARMEAFARENGLRRAARRHREIYLSNARRTPSCRLKTILRFSVAPCRDEGTSAAP